MVYVRTRTQTELCRECMFVCTCSNRVRVGESKEATATDLDILLEGIEVLLRVAGAVGLPRTRNVKRWRASTDCPCTAWTMGRLVFWGGGE